MRNVKKLKKVIFLLRYITLSKEICQSLTERLACAGIEVSFVVQEDETRETGDDILWVVDCKEQAAFHDKKVVVYLHEYNSGTDFSGCTYFIEGFEDVGATYFIRIFERFHDIPWVIAKTLRLQIREMAVKDLDAIYELYEHPEHLPFLPPLQENREEEKEYLKRYIQNMYGIFEYGMWLVETTTGEVIGRMGVENTDEEDVLSFGFLIRPDARRKGYALEAGKALLKYLKEEYPYFQIVAFCHPQNVAARSLCDKLGICVKCIN